MFADTIPAYSLYEHKDINSATTWVRQVYKTTIDVLEHYSTLNIVPISKLRNIATKTNSHSKRLFGVSDSYISRTQEEFFNTSFPDKDYDNIRLTHYPNVICHHYSSHKVIKELFLAKVDVTVPLLKPISTNKLIKLHNNKQFIIKELSLRITDINADLYSTSMNAIEMNINSDNDILNISYYLLYSPLNSKPFNYSIDKALYTTSAIKTVKNGKNSLDLSQMIEEAKTNIFVTCHGHFDGDLNLTQNSNIVYVDNSYYAIPDVFSDIFTDIYKSCHCYDEAYSVHCPIYAGLDEESLTRMIRNMWNVLKAGGLWYLPYKSKNNKINENDELYKLLTKTYFEYENYINAHTSLTKFGKLLVLRAVE